MSLAELGRRLCVCWGYWHAGENTPVCVLGLCNSLRDHLTLARVQEGPQITVWTPEDAL